MIGVQATLAPSPCKGTLHSSKSAIYANAKYNMTFFCKLQLYKGLSRQTTGKRMFTGLIFIRKHFSQMTRMIC